MPFMTITRRSSPSWSSGDALDATTDGPAPNSFAAYARFGVLSASMANPLGNVQRSPTRLR